MGGDSEKWFKLETKKYQICIILTNRNENRNKIYKSIFEKTWKQEQSIIFAEVFLRLDLIFDPLFLFWSERGARFGRGRMRASRQQIASDFDLCLYVVLRSSGIKM